MLTQRSYTLPSRSATPPLDWYSDHSTTRRPTPVRRYSAPSRSVLPHPGVYAALYTTLQARWSRQGDEIAAHGEIARIYAKRPHDDDESDADLDAAAASHPLVPSLTQGDDESDVDMCGGDEEETDARAPKRLRTVAPTGGHELPHRPSTAEPSTPLLAVASDAHQSRRSSSVPVFDRPTHSPVDALLYLANSGQDAGKLERVEGLLKVVRSFENVLGCRAESWRSIQRNLA